MKDPRGAKAPSTLFDSIDWDDPNAHVVDGFTVAEIELFVIDSVVPARCTECGDETEVEPDARGYICQSCNADGTVTSPLVKIGLI